MKNICLNCDNYIIIKVNFIKMNNHEKISINETLNVIRKALQNENNENLNESNILILDKMIQEDGKILKIQKPNTNNLEDNEVVKLLDNRIQKVLDKHLDKWLKEKLPKFINKYLSKK